MTIDNHFIPSLEKYPISGDIDISFEFFPPKTPEMELALWDSVQALKSFNPHFVSVTYGAGGSTRQRTISTVLKIKNETKLKPAAHLTCVGASKDEIDTIAQEYWDKGIKHIVAIRGDSQNQGAYVPHPDGYNYASDLVAGLKNIADFEISVAAYPQKHPEAPSFDSDITHLKEKIDAGAARAITQYFFDTDCYFKFLDKTAQYNISAPIVPGIYLITNLKNLLKFSKMCGATVPKWVIDLLSNMDDSTTSSNIVTAMIAAEQCRILHSRGIKKFHFYTMNRPDIAVAVCKILGIKNTI